MAKGGKRPGAGRPLGARTKLMILDYITEEEVKELVKIAKAQAAAKPDLMRFLLEQVFGKARQPIEGTGPEGEFVIQWQK